MANAPRDEAVFDRSEYKRADQQLKLVRTALPEDAVAKLAREVVQRLAIKRSDRPDIPDYPSLQTISDFCDALLSDDETAGDGIILAARREGVSIRAIYVGYLAGAAALLGERWDDDEASFVSVTIASGRLYRIIRGLRHTIVPFDDDGEIGKQAFFALVPGETHTLGVEIATDLFRRDGWEVELAVDLSHDAVVEKAHQSACRLIVLVANSQTVLGNLTRLVVALRIDHPTAYVAVAGKIVDQFPKIVDLTGVDCVITKLDTAVATVQRMINKN